MRRHVCVCVHMYVCVCECVYACVWVCVCVRAGVYTAKKSFGNPILPSKTSNVGLVAIGRVRRILFRSLPLSSE